MAASEETCDENPNFAVICSFITKFGHDCGINVSIPDLQQMLEDTKHVSPVLQEIIIHLMRRGRKRVNKEKWEKSLAKFCHEYSSVDAWELERFGFPKAKLSVKLEILKRLLELQFDANAKFKAEVNKHDAKVLRLLPLGRDIDGQAYWYQLDKDYNMRLYRESMTDDHVWHLMCSTTDDIRDLLERLEKKYSSSTGATFQLDLNNGPKSPPPDDLPVPKNENEEMTSSISESKPCTIIIKTEKKDRDSSREPNHRLTEENSSDQVTSKAGQMTSTTIEDDKGGVKLKLKFESSSSRTEQTSLIQNTETRSKKDNVKECLSDVPMDVDTEKATDLKSSLSSKDAKINDVEMTEVTKESVDHVVEDVKMNDVEVLVKKDSDHVVEDVKMDDAEKLVKKDGVEDVKISDVEVLVKKDDVENVVEDAKMNDVDSLESVKKDSIEIVPKNRDINAAGIKDKKDISETKEPVSADTKHLEISVSNSCAKTPLAKDSEPVTYKSSKIKLYEKWNSEKNKANISSEKSSSSSKAVLKGQSNSDCSTSDKPITPDQCELNLSKKHDCDNVKSTISNSSVERESVLNLSVSSHCDAIVEKSSSKCVLSNGVSAATKIMQSEGDNPTDLTVTKSKEPVIKSDNNVKNAFKSNERKKNISDLPIVNHEGGSVSGFSHLQALQTMCETNSMGGLSSAFQSVKSNVIKHDIDDTSCIAVAEQNNLSSLQCSNYKVQTKNFENSSVLLKSNIRKIDEGSQEPEDMCSNRTVLTTPYVPSKGQPSSHHSDFVATDISKSSEHQINVNNQNKHSSAANESVIEEKGTEELVSKIKNVECSSDLNSENKLCVESLKSNTETTRTNVQKNKVSIPDSKTSNLEHSGASKSKSSVESVGDKFICDKNPEKECNTVSKSIDVKFQNSSKESSDLNVTSGKIQEVSDIKGNVSKEECKVQVSDSDASKLIVVEKSDNSNKTKSDYVPMLEKSVPETSESCETNKKVVDKPESISTDVDSKVCQIVDSTDSSVSNKSLNQKNEICVEGTVNGPCVKVDVEKEKSSLDNNVENAVSESTNSDENNPTLSKSLSEEEIKVEFDSRDLSTPTTSCTDSKKMCADIEKRENSEKHASKTSHMNENEKNSDQKLKLSEIGREDTASGDNSSKYKCVSEVEDSKQQCDIAGSGNDSKSATVEVAPKKSSIGDDDSSNVACDKKNNSKSGSNSESETVESASIIYSKDNITSPSDEKNDVHKSSSSLTEKPALKEVEATGALSLPKSEPEEVATEVMPNKCDSLSSLDGKSGLTEAETSSTLSIPKSEPKGVTTKVKTNKCDSLSSSEGKSVMKELEATGALSIPKSEPAEVSTEVKTDKCDSLSSSDGKSGLKEAETSSNLSTPKSEAKEVTAEVKLNNCDSLSSSEGKSLEKPCSPLKSGDVSIALESNDKTAADDVESKMETSQETEKPCGDEHSDTIASKKILVEPKPSPPSDSKNDSADLSGENKSSKSPDLSSIFKEELVRDSDCYKESDELSDKIETSQPIKSVDDKEKLTDNCNLSPKVSEPSADKNEVTESHSKLDDSEEVSKREVLVCKSKSDSKQKYPCDNKVKVESNDEKETASSELKLNDKETGCERMKGTENKNESSECVLDSELLSKGQSKVVQDTVVKGNGSECDNEIIKATETKDDGPKCLIDKKEVIKLPEEDLKVYFFRNSLCLDSKMKHPFHSRYLRVLPEEEPPKKLLTELSFDISDDEPLIHYSNAAKILKAQFGKNINLSGKKTQARSLKTSPVKVEQTKKTPTKRAPRNRKKETEKDDFNIPEGFLEILGNTENKSTNKSSLSNKRKKCDLKDDQTSQQSSENEANTRKRSRRIQEQHQKKMSELAVEMEREQRIIEQMAKKSNANKNKTPQKTPTKGNASKNTNVKSPGVKTPIKTPNKTPTKNVKTKGKLEIPLIEEETCMESKRGTRKMNNRSKNLTKMTLMYEDESKDSQFSTSRETEKSKRRRRRRARKRGGFKPWDVSSESTSSVEEITEEEEEEPEEILVFDVNEDEFACEEVEQDAEPVVIRRARTAKKTEGVAEEVVVDDKPCKKCGKHDKPEWILLCDKCDSGYHTHCLIPPLMIIPDGDWFCQPCEHMFLCQCLQEELKKLETILKQREREALRKQRLAYVGISLDNALKPEKKEEEEEEKEESSETSEDTEEGDHKPKKVKEHKTVKETSEDERHQKLYAKRSVRARRNVNYRFKEYDELIASALQEELGDHLPPEVMKGGGEEEKDEDASDANSDRPFTAKISKRKRKTRSFRDLDDFSDEDDSGDEYQGGSTDSEATPPPASESEPDSHPSDAEWGVRKTKSKSRSRQRQKPRNRRRRRRGRGGSSEEEDEEDWSEEELEDSDNQRPLTRRSAAQKAISYREISSEEEDEWKAKSKPSKRRKSTSSSEEENESSFKKKETKKKRIKKWASSDSESEEKSESSSEESEEEENSEESQNEFEIQRKERMRLKASTNKKVLSSEEDDEESSTQNAASKKKSKKVESEEESEGEEEEDEEEEDEEEEEESEYDEESEEEEKPKKVSSDAKCVPEKKAVINEKDKILVKSSTDNSKLPEKMEISETRTSVISGDEKSTTENVDLHPKVIFKKEPEFVSESDICSLKTQKKDTTKMVPCVIPYEKSSPKISHPEMPEAEVDNVPTKEMENTITSAAPKQPLQYPNQVPPPLAPLPPSRIHYGHPERYAPPHMETAHHPPPSYPGNRMPPRLLPHPSMQRRLPVDPGNMPLRYGPPTGMPVRPSPSGHMPMRPSPSSSMMMRSSPPTNVPMRPGPSSSISMRPGPSSNIPMRPGPSSGMPMRPGPSSGMPMRPGPSSGMPMRPGPSSGMPMRTGPPGSMSMRPGPPGSMTRPGPPGSMLMRPGPPGSMPMRPEPPGSMPMRPEPPSGMPMRPELPSGMPMRPEPPSSMPMRPEPPSSMPMRPEPPSSMTMRPEPVSSMPMRPELPSSMPMRPEPPSSMPMRHGPPSSQPMRPGFSSNMPIRPGTSSNIGTRPSPPSTTAGQPNVSNKESGQDDASSNDPPQSLSSKAPPAQSVQSKSDEKPPFKSKIMEPFEENDSDDEVPLERIPTACVPTPLSDRPASFEKDAEYRPAAKELSTFNYASSEEKPFSSSYSPMSSFQDYSDRPSPLKPSLVETYPNSSSPSKLTSLDTYSRSNSPKGFISLDSYSENKKKKQHFYGNSASEAEGSSRPSRSSDNYQGGEIRFPPEPYPCPQSPNSYRSPPPSSQRDAGTPPRLYSQFPDAYAPPRSPEYYQNHQYYASEERIPRPSYQPNYAASDPPSFVSNPYVATPVPQPNGGFMIDTLLRARNPENEEDELTGVTDIVSYITQE